MYPTELSSINNGTALHSSAIIAFCGKMRNNDPSILPEVGRPFKIHLLGEREGVELADALLENTSVTYFKLEIKEYTKAPQWLDHRDATEVRHNFCADGGWEDATDQVAHSLLSDGCPTRFLFISFRVVPCDAYGPPDRLCTWEDPMSLDECGLRRHNINPTVRHLGQVCKRHQQLVGRVPNVLLMQNGVLAKDVQFYTEEVGITNGDRTHIAALKLNKPIIMPPSRPLPISDKDWRP
jgi:hypothetical protein